MGKSGQEKSDPWWRRNWSKPSSGIILTALLICLVDNQQKVRTQLLSTCHTRQWFPIVWGSKPWAVICVSNRSFISRVPLWSRDIYIYKYKSLADFVHGFHPIVDTLQHYKWRKSTFCNVYQHLTVMKYCLTKQKGLFKMMHLWQSSSGHPTVGSCCWWEPGCLIGLCWLRPHRGP